MAIVMVCARAESDSRDVALQKKGFCLLTEDPYSGMQTRHVKDLDRHDRVMRIVT
jgi:hypothetical protein